MKVEQILFGFALAIIMAKAQNQYYNFVQKWNCDTQVTTTFNSDMYKIFAHQNYYIQYDIPSTSSYTLYRPDLKILVTYTVLSQGHSCQTRTAISQVSPFTKYYLYKEPINYQGMTCWLYYNTTDINYFIADEEDQLLLVNRDGVNQTYANYDYTPLTPSTFVMPTAFSGCGNEEIYQAPDLDLYNKACDEEPSQLHKFEQKWGCDIQFIFTRNGDFTQYKVKKHQHFIKVESIGSTTWLVLYRPDLRGGVEFDRQWYDITEDNLLFLPDPFIVYFTHKEETTYEGQACTKFYNNSNTYILVDRASNIIYIKMVVNNFAMDGSVADYDHSPIPPSEFIISSNFPTYHYSTFYQAPQVSQYYNDYCPGSAATQKACIFLCLFTFVLSKLLQVSY